MKGSIDLYNRELVSIAECHHKDYELDDEGWGIKPDLDDDFTEQEKECVFALRLRGSPGVNLCSYLLEKKYDDELKMMISNYLLAKNKFKGSAQSISKYYIDDYDADFEVAEEELAAFIMKVLANIFKETINDDYELVIKEMKAAHYQEEMDERLYVEHLQSTSP